jgi:hypothetical protein
MKEFNHKVKPSKNDIKNSHYLKLIYDPKIDVFINQKKGKFLKTIDSSYINNLKNKISKELAELNIYVDDNQEKFTLTIDHFYMLEHQVEGTDSDNNPTVEISASLSLKGKLHDNENNTIKYIQSDIYHTTHTGMSFLSALFKTSAFDIQKGNTFKEKMIENNLIKMFAIKCLKNIQ